ncbi:Hypothetical predicted protein [Octopus vulgaris]|uniref:Uncharacterized protein n=1 Tax=Octopus vulgaris TaxID=6645 RepID=A0AA36BTA8_OCTVU|nr:Hypothetical predicted protein [Octopus vulgaris]
MEQKSPEANDKGVKKKGEELQSDGYSQARMQKIQTIELRWRGELEEQGNGRRKKHRGKQKYGEKHNEIGWKIIFHSRIDLAVVEMER